MSPAPLAQRVALGLMHPAQVVIPFHHAGSIYEEKLDGYRMAAMRARESLSLVSRNGIHHAKRFPDLVQALNALTTETFLLDGEVAVYDQAFISRFEWLRGRPKDVLATEPARASG